MTEAGLMRLIREADAMTAPRTEADGWPPALDLEALSEREPQPPKFIIPDWLPVGYVTLLAGHGGVGKSAIALYLSACIALGRPWYGLPTERRSVLYLSCEDRESVLHWRLSRICRDLGIDLFSLHQRLQILDLVGCNSLLFDRDPQTRNVLSPGYGALDERIREYGTELLVVDGISDVFGGNENARGEVKRLVNSLVALIPPDTGAVLLVGHVSKPDSTAGANADGYTGSTGWHNSARARWYLYPETVEGEDGERRERTGDLILELQKSNLGRIDQSMRIRWDPQAHLFTGEVVGNSRFDRKRQERTERAGILRALKACADAGIIVPAALHGPRTIYSVLTIRPEFPASLKGLGDGKRRRLRRHIEQLRQMRAIEETEYRRSHRKTGLQFVLTAEGMRQCAESSEM